MNIKKIKTLLIVLPLVSAFGCAAGLMPVGAIHAPNGIGGSLVAGDSTEEPTRVGRATATSALGLIATGDASIQTAMKNGGITKMHHVDYVTTVKYGLKAETTVLVYGN